MLLTVLRWLGRLSLRSLWPRIRGLWLLWLIAAGVLVVGSILWAAVFEPSWLLPDTRGLSPADRVRAVTDLRNTLVTMLGGLAVLVGAVVGGLSLRETSRQNRAALELQGRGQVTERFTRAIEQLGDDKRDVRIGAAYALEQIARDSAELHWPIMEVLTAYLREHVPRPSTPPADAAMPRRLAEAVATVIGRHRQGPDDRRLDVHETDLTGVQWLDADLQGADLNGADLERASLSGANLMVAFLEGANLQRATFHRTQLQLAALERANLEGAFLWEANLWKAKLNGASLAGAVLWQANLTEADLRGANLERAKLEGAHLPRANLDGARLAGADLSKTLGLSWDQLELAVDAALAQLPADLAGRLGRASATPLGAAAEGVRRARS